MTGILPHELTRPIVRKSKTATAFLSNMQHPFRGSKVNYLGEPSFRAWIIAGVPFYALAAKKRLPPWRWLLMVVPHIYLLDGEANNTAHEESIRSHRAQTWHFRNAMDSASFSVFLRFIASIICALYALFGPDPWKSNAVEDNDLRQQLAQVVRERHIVTGAMSANPSATQRARLIRQAKALNQQEKILLVAIKAMEHEAGEPLG